MKPHPGTSLTILLGLLFVASRLEAAPPSDDSSFPETAVFSVPSATDNVHWETTRLIQQDAHQFELKRTPAQHSSGPDAPDLLILDRLVVKQRPPETLPPVGIETGAQEFFRTGTIAEHIGTQVTTHLWLHPSLGLRLSFEF
jgi:hypothetical protein